jgi:hypothetical protein
MMGSGASWVGLLPAKPAARLHSSFVAATWRSGLGPSRCGERLILNARRDPVAEAAAALAAEVRAEVKASGAGVRIVKCQPPSKSPWLNPIEPKRARGQHKGVEPGRLLPMTDLEERVSAALGADHAGHLARLDRVA